MYEYDCQGARPLLTAVVFVHYCIDVKKRTLVYGRKLQLLLPKYAH